MAGLEGSTGCSVQVALYPLLVHGQTMFILILLHMLFEHTLCSVRT